MTKKIITIGLVLLYTIGLYSQVNTSNISFELRYPVPVGNNFINKAFFGDGYLGLMDLAIDYNVLKFNELALGITLNSSVLRASSVSDITLLILSPKIKFEYELNLNRVSLIPQIGFGYSNWRYYAILQYTNEIGEPAGTISDKSNSNGLTFQALTKLKINSGKSINWYFLITYEFTKLEKPEIEGADTKFNRNIHIVYPGIGLQWNFNNK